MGTTAQHTYALKCGQFIKVGRTDNVHRRLRQIQTANPNRVYLLGYIDEDCEREAHQWLAECGVRRVRGEWFEDGDQTRDALMAVGILVDPAK